MTIEAMKLALDALETLMIERGSIYEKAITALKERLAQPEQEPVPTLEDLEQEIYQNTRNFISRDVMEWMLRRYYTHLPQRTEQEPVELPCCGYTDASAVKWNPFNGVVQCHNCGQCYTTPPQRTWVGLTGEDVVKAYDDYQSGRFSAGFMGATRSIEAKLKQKNGYAEEKNAICSPFMISELWKLHK